MADWGRASVCAMFRVIVVCALVYLAYGTNDDSDSCKLGKFECECGSTGRKFHVPIKQCAYPDRVDKNKKRCKPCDNANAETFCRKFRKCAECNNNECTKCPQNRSGKKCSRDKPVNASTESVVQSRSCHMPNVPGNMLTIINPGETSKPVDANGREVVREIGFLCGPGFSLDGPAKIRCQSSGKWDQRIPSCVGTLLCPPPGEIHKGEIEISGGKEGALVPGTQLSIKCKNTHFLYGPQIVSCTTAGIWSSGLPKCLKKFGCPPPSPPNNGRVEITRAVRKQSKRSSEYGHRRRRAVKEPPRGYSDVNSRALYECKSAFYNLIGPTSRVCQVNGQWSGQEPTCTAVCGKAGDSKQPSIFNGTAMKVGQWPWQAAISTRETDDGTFSLACGGSLVSDRLVLTAAHCVTEKFTSNPLPVKQLRIYLGKHFRDDSKDDSAVVLMSVDFIIVHPNFHPRSMDTDIALLELSGSVQFTHRISPVCLPQTTSRPWRGDIPENVVGTTTGWGKDENNMSSGELEAAELPVITRQKCEEDIRGLNVSFTLTGNMFCAGFEKGGVGTCEGDSGGPFMVESGSGPDTKWTQEGIASFLGAIPCGAFKHYSGFTKVSNFIEWINQYL